MACKKHPDGWYFEIKGNEEIGPHPTLEMCKQQEEEYWRYVNNPPIGDRVTFYDEDI